MREKVTISWSGGKDCMMALHQILLSKQFDAHSLHTSFNKETNRVGLHGVKHSMIELQAQSLGIPLDTIFIPASENHDAYDAAIKKYYLQLASKGIRKVVFGDIFLEDLRAFREKILSACGLEGVFPLWKQESRLLAKQFMALGFKAIICSADSKYFDEQVAGSNYDNNFINSLPPEVDPCGENGEFHTFVIDGPVFKKSISLELGERVAKDYHYQVSLPDGSTESHTRKFWFRELNQRSQ